MKKFKIYSIRSTTYLTEVEAENKDEAIDLFWDDKTEDIELDGSFEVKIDEVQEVSEDGWSCFKCNFAGTEQEVEDHACPAGGTDNDDHQCDKSEYKCSVCGKRGMN